MVSRQIFAGGLAAGVLCLAIIGLSNAFPTSLEETASLAIRDASGTAVAEYFDQPELIKRVNVKLFTASLTALGGISYTACAADIEPTTKAAICAIAVIGTVISAVSGVIRSLYGRDGLALDPRLPSQLVHLYPQVEGATTLKQLYTNYSGAPVLTAYSDCYGPGCHQVHYSYKKSSVGDHIIHHFAVSPRVHSNSTVSKRQDQDGSGNDGGLYGDYRFINDNPTDEDAEGHDGDFPDNMERASDNDIFANQGAFCYDIEDADDNDNYGTAGYLTLQQDEPYQDPDEEDTWINQCNNMH